MHGPYTEEVHRHLADTLIAVARAVDAGEIGAEALPLVRLLNDARQELWRLSRGGGEGRSGGGQGSSVVMPWRMAYLVSRATLSMPSFCVRFRRWVSTVFTLTPGPPPPP